MNSQTNQNLFSGNFLFKSIVEKSQDLVIVCHEDLTIKYLNSSARQVIGEARHFNEIIADEQLEMFEAQLGELKRNQYGDQNNSILFRNRAGKTFDMNYNVSEFTTDDSIYLVFDCRDISDLIRTQKGLRQVQEILKGISYAAAELNKIGNFGEKFKTSLIRFAHSIKADSFYYYKIDSTESNESFDVALEWNCQVEKSNHKTLYKSELTDELLQVHQPIFFSKQEIPSVFQKNKELCASLLYLPLFIDQQFFGFILLFNCGQEVIWNDDEIAVIKNYILKLELAIQRDNYQTELAESASLTTLNPNPVVRVKRNGEIVFKNVEANLIDKPIISQASDDYKKRNWIEYITHNIDEHNRKLELEISNRRSYYSVIAILSEDNRFINIYLADISSQKVAERSILRATESLSLFKNLINNSSDAVQVSLENGSLFYLNQEAAKNLSIDPADIQKYTVLDIENRFENIQQWNEHVKELKKVENLTAEGLQVNQQTGRQFSVEVSVKYLKVNERGFIIANARDISERKKKENQLRLQEEKYRNIISNMNLGLLEVDLKDNIIYANKSFETISGYNLDELKGKNASKVFLTNDLAKVMRKKNRLRLREESDSYEIQAINKEGNFRWWLISGAPNYNDKGEIIGSIGIHLDITEEKNNEFKLAEERQRLEYVIKGTNLGTWELDIYRQQRTLAEGWQHILGGRSKKDLTLSQAEWETLIHPEDLPFEIDSLQKHLEEKTDFFQVQLRMRHKKGHWVWIELTGKILSNLNEATQRIYGTAKEITEAKKLENELKTTAAKFQSIYDLNPVGIALNDFKTGQFIDVNDALVKSTEYSKDEILKLDYFDLTPKKYAEKEKEQLSKLLETRQYGPYEKEYIAKSGKRYPVLLNGIIFTDQNNREVILSTVQDISERKKYENHLKTQRSALRSLNEINSLTHLSLEEQLNEALKLGAEFLNMELGIISAIDLESREYLVTHQYSSEGQLEAGMEFSLDQTYCDITISQRDLVAIENMKDSIYKAHPCYENFQLESYIGIPFIINDEIKGTLNFSSFSPRKNNFYSSEIEFIRLLGKWVNSVMERNIFIQSLQIAKNQAEREGRAKESFLTNMSHEIRTPLNGIVGMMRELNKEELTFEQRNYINRASLASDHLLDIVNNILDISKIEAGELILESNDFEISDLMKDVAEILRIPARANRNSFKVQVDPELSKYFRGDAFRLRQVLLNLTGNSVKFTEGGTISLIANFLNENDTHQYIQLEVCDTGIGIDGEYLERIFDKFQQEDASISRKYGGTGLGMVITKELVELMGGEISISSQKGEGTQVKIQLSLEKATQANYKPVTKNISGFVELESPLRILLVEDNEINRLVATNSLALISSEVTEAVNGQEAVEILQKKAFDLVLMDVQMPVMDGIEATKHIRDKLQLDTPIIALSANAFKSEIDLTYKVGMNDYLTKPYEEEEFIQKILKHTQKGKSKGAQNISKANDEKRKEANSDGLYSLKAIQDMSRGNPAFVKKMCNVFIESVQEAESEIESALQQGDFERIGKLVHRIKPSILNMNINSLKEDIKYLEKIDNNENKDLVANKLNEFFSIINDVVADLKLHSDDSS